MYRYDKEALTDLSQKKQDEGFLDNLIQELHDFRFAAPAMVDFQNKWDMIGFQTCLFNTNLQHLPRIMSAVMPAKYRLGFLNNTLSPKKYARNPELKKRQTISRNFHPGFLEMLNNIDQQEVIEHLSQAVRVLTPIEQKKFAKRLLSAGNLDELAFNMAKILLAGLAVKLPLSQHVHKPPQKASARSIDRFKRQALPESVSPRTRARQLPTPSIELTNNLDQQFTPATPMQPTSSLIIPSIFFNPFLAVENSHPYKRSFPFVKTLPNNHSAKRPRLNPPPVNYVTKNRFFSDIQTKGSAITDPIILRPDNETQDARKDESREWEQWLI